ncbi:hypothetical protein PR202_ga08608 [Eleusine coracana subsp. coracana]|uniref:KIB1-4 beta-propeller domain-containing protein n=1 Tax=Eleusine coracana subsp. coracana TaxID=191504 RepID=A0AAV5C342_ELECO|nr:hypothetical protein QOZ80_1AG0043330 [Eleusine coracana subsp. coracana]GJM92172.1 hypothetical protein PR202_ga08608 [Eleusine coracana subsp. coracana]
MGAAVPRLPPLWPLHGPLSASDKTRRIIVGDVDDALLKDKVVCPTAQGFLLVRDSATMATFLCNPRNGDKKIHLPPLHDMEDSVLMDSHCLLSDEPTVPGCVVLLVETEVAAIRYCHPSEDDQWVKYDYDIGTLPVDFNDDSLYEQEVICPIAAYRGKFYFNPLGRTEMGVLEFCPEPVFSSIEIDDSIAVDGSYGYEDENECGEIRLVESDGELYMVTMVFDAQSANKYEICRASVHRMDFAHLPHGGVRGEIYFNSLRNELRLLEFCPDPVFSSVTLVVDESDDESEDDDEEDGHEPQRPASVFHVESGGDLYMVKLYYASAFRKEVVEGVVDKMDFAEMRWRRVDDLGGRTFFLSRFYFGVSCSCGESGAKRDCVYMVTPWKKEMLVFDVKDGTLSLHKLDEAPFANKAFWLLPKEDSRHV